MPFKHHVLILTPGFPTHEMDDICVPYIQDFLLAFAEHDSPFKFTIVAFQYPGHHRSYTWKGVRVHALGGDNNKFLKPLTWWRAWTKAKTIHQSDKVDTVLSFWLGETAWIGQKTAQDLGANHIAVAMGQDVLPINRYLKRLDSRRTKIVAVSKRMAQALKQNSKLISCKTIPFAEPKVRQAVPNQWDDREVDILGVGSLIRLKRFEDWVQVVKECISINPSLKAVLIGEGPEMGTIMAQIVNSGMENQIKVVGKCSRENTLEWMKKSKVLLHPSEYEGMGYVFTEALNRGMCVVSKATGLAEPSSSWKVAEDPAGMKLATLEFLEEGPSVPAHRDWEGMAKAMVDAYKDLFVSR